VTLAALRFDLRMTAQCVEQTRQVAAEVKEGAGPSEAREAERVVKLSEAVFESTVREYLRKLR
jgi:hypothetical protein